VSVADREHLRDLASLHALGVLSHEERAELAQAMAADPELAAEVRALEDVGGALGGAVAQIDPPARLRGRVLAAAGIDAGTVSAAAPAVTEPASTGRVVPMPVSTAPVARASALPGWLAAAAAVVLASGLGLWALQLRTQLDTMSARVTRAEADVVELRRTLDQSQAQTVHLQAQNNLLFAPDMQRVDLAGQPVAPGSTARAFVSGTRGMAFAANQLPALPADKVYQLWVIPQGQAPVSAGLLRPDASGHATTFFTMPPGTPPAAVVAVTIEPAGGVPAPTGDKVLVGEVATAAE
jgi:anti-sigma-K factor RskA